MQTNEPPAPQTAWLGIDVAKATFDVGIHLPVACGQPARDIRDIPTGTFERTSQGVDEMLAWASARRTGRSTVLRCVMEATGRYSIELATMLTDKNAALRPVIDDARAIRDYARSLKLRNKTDAIDAAVLARYGAERMPDPKPAMPSHYRELRERNRLRDALVSDLAAARMRLTEMAAGSTVATIQRSVVCNLEKALSKIDKALRAWTDEHADLRKDIKLMQSIPGVGFITAVTVLAECGPMANFRRSRSLGSYAGLAPRIRESGTSVRGGTHITRRGPAKLRQALYMASIAAGNRIPALAALKKRMTEKGKPPMSARCAVMRKLLITMRAVVVNQTPFSLNYCH
ncbi:MAG: IS110 family transposase [Candidatus Pacebacteria bacterium]|nr:IS110 family transposase [Candidatus Paceibacterota bacterium]